MAIQSPDRQRLFIQGRCKKIGVPWTEQEMLLIVSSDNRWEEIKRLREESPAKHDFEIKAEEKANKLNELENLTKKLENEWTVDRKEEQSNKVPVDDSSGLEIAIKDEETLSLEELQGEYEKKFSKPPANSYKNNIERLKKKLLK